MLDRTHFYVLLYMSVIGAAVYAARKLRKIRKINKQTNKILENWKNT
jgi:hypothetical protein